MSGGKKVFFLIRSYNDLDCRIPLMMSFLEDNSVCVVGIPVSNGYKHTEEHELFSFLKHKGIEFKSIFLFKNVPRSIRTVYWVHKKMSQVVRKLLWKITSHKVSFLVSIFLNAFIAFPLKFKTNWIPKVIEEMKDSIIIIDEIILQKNRSIVIDEIVRNKDQIGLSIYAIQTGQNTFINLWHDKKIKKIESYPERIARKFIVPGPIDLKIVKENWPNEDAIIGGNIRFDSSWVKMVDHLVSKNSKVKEKIGIKNKYRIVFMLSKAEYGTIQNNLIDAVNTCCTLSDTAVIIKPHTRGMTINEFRNRLKTDIIDGSPYSSNELMHWSNIVLFTGSSIIFQAMLLKKKVIYLQYCHKYKTIHDNSGAVYKAKDSDELLEIIINESDDSIDLKRKQDFLKTIVHNDLDSGLVSENMKIQIEQWEGISS